MKTKRFSPLFFLAGAVLLAAASPSATIAQSSGPADAPGGPVGPPPAVVTRPGGDGNKSQYEYAPENQPSWEYSAPGSFEDGCTNENALLRDQLRDMETQVLQLTGEIATLKARNSALQKASAAQ